MIELSPLDVRKKKDDFDLSLRGYDKGQVDSFLDVVAERLEALVSERRELRDRVSSLEERLSDFRERERALNEALLAAQELREEARSQAERDAELRLREAESRAEDIVGEARREARDARSEIERLHRKREQLLHSLRAVLRRFGEELEAEEARLREEGRPEEPDGGRGGERTARARTAADGTGAAGEGAADAELEEGDLSLLPEDEPGEGDAAPAARGEGEAGREGGGG